MSSDDTPPIPADDPTAAPRGRNRHPDAAMPGGPGDPVVGRLRTALDELTTGAEPNAARLPATLADRRRPWMLPAVAAAAVALVVGIAVAVVGRGDGGTPAAPTPTGPPVTPLSTSSSTIPWYTLNHPGAQPHDVRTTPASATRMQGWADAGYSRVLTAAVMPFDGAGQAPTDWPIATPIDGFASGQAWHVAYDDTGDVWFGIYWAPDEHTGVIVNGYGFSQDDLDQVARQLSIGRDDAGPYVISPLSSLSPLPGSLVAAPRVSQSFTVSGEGDVEPFIATLSVIRGGPTQALVENVWSWTVVGTLRTPFGDGVQILTDDLAIVWWPVRETGYWAGVTAPLSQRDAVLAGLSESAGIVAPAVVDGPAQSLPHATSAASAAITTPDATLGPIESALGSSTPTPPADAGSSGAPTTAPTPTTVPVAQRPPLAFGESVMLSAAKSLEAAGFTVVAQEAVQASGIVQMIRDARAAEQLGRIAIVQVGTNGTITQGELDQMMAEMPPQETLLVIFLTVHADRSWIAANNELIRALPERYSNVVIVDWDLIATENPDVLTSDGIHVEQREVYADAIASVIGVS